MLVLSRHVNEEVIIGEPPNTIRVVVTDIRGDKVRLGFEAEQPGLPIHRKEVYQAILREREQQAKRPLRDLGWMNGWADDSPYHAIIAECIRKKHQPTDVDRSGRGVEHVITCAVCRYTYRVDSSD